MLLFLGEHDIFKVKVWECRVNRTLPFPGNQFYFTETFVLIDTNAMQNSQLQAVTASKNRRQICGT